MKVLGLVCSPRKGGNTEILVSEALAAAADMGAQTEIFTIAGKDIRFCDGCLKCRKAGECRIKDDVTVLYAKLREADGIIFGSPVYFWGVTAQAKAIIDRTYALHKGRELKGKVAGAIVVTRRSGGTLAFSQVHDFFNLQNMVSCAGGVSGADILEERGGGAIAYGGDRGEVREDKRGIAEARAVGEAVVRAIQERKSP